MASGIPVLKKSMRSGTWGVEKLLYKRVALAQEVCKTIGMSVSSNSGTFRLVLNNWPLKCHVFTTIHQGWSLSTGKGILLNAKSKPFSTTTHAHSSGHWHQPCPRKNMVPRRGDSAVNWCITSIWISDVDRFFLWNPYRSTCRWMKNPKVFYVLLMWFCMLYFQVIILTIERVVLAHGVTRLPSVCQDRHCVCNVCKGTFDLPPQELSNCGLPSCRLWSKSFVWDCCLYYHSMIGEVPQSLWFWCHKPRSSNKPSPSRNHRSPLNFPKGKNVFFLVFVVVTRFVACFRHQPSRKPSGRIEERWCPTWLVCECPVWRWLERMTTITWQR